MNGYLLDTNVISEPARPSPEPRVTAWLDSSEEGLLYLSVLTLGEIRKGISMLDKGPKRARLEAWHAEIILRFAGRILPVEGAVADHWGRMAARAEIEGRALQVIDGLLAATALHYNLTLVSRDVRGAEAAGVTVLNPWTA